MAAKACKLICLVIFFAFVTQGYGQHSLILKQRKTGIMVKNKPEWEVIVTNPTGCQFSNIELSCVGFKSVTTIESSVLSKFGDDLWLLNNGDRIGPYSDFVFKYVWDTRFDFKISASTIACS